MTYDECKLLPVQSFTHLQRSDVSRNDFFTRINEFYTLLYLIMQTPFSTVFVRYGLSSLDPCVITWEVHADLHKFTLRYIRPCQSGSSMSVWLMQSEWTAYLSIKRFYNLNGRHPCL